MTENLHAVNAVDFAHEWTEDEREKARRLARAAMLMPEDAEFSDLIYSPHSADVTLTVEPDLSKFRVVLARSAGKQALADVIEDQPGRQIVRDGMGDVLHWLRECSCYTDREPCPYIDARQQAAFERMAALTGQTAAALRNTFEAFARSVQPTAERLRDLANAMARAQTAARQGRAAQRSPYGPQGHR